MELLKITDRDFTNCIVLGSYTINSIPVYNEWTDANYTKHKDIVRKRVTGTLSLKFFEEDDYTDFLRLVEENTKNDGTIPLTVYVNNIDRAMTIDAFLDVKFPNLLPVVGQNANKEISVSIEER